MPRNSSGIYSPPSGTLATSGQVISSSAYNAFINDLSTEISNSLNISGTAAFAANQNAGGFLVTNLGTPVNPQDSAPKSYVDASTPSGVVSMYAGATAPSGWLFCQGQAVSRTTYANLYSAIGTSYGVGDGSTTFNVPNFQTFMPIGAGSYSGHTTRSLGATGGEEAHTLSVAEMPAHNHTDNGHTHTDSGHTHAASAGSFVLQNGAVYFAGGSTGPAGTGISGNTGNGSASIQSGTANIQNNGGGGAHNTMPPFLVVNFIIKT